MLHGFSFQNFICQHQLLRRPIQIPVISHSSMPGTYALSVRRKPNQTDNGVTFPDRAIIGK